MYYSLLHTCIIKFIGKVLGWGLLLLTVLHYVQYEIYAFYTTYNTSILGFDVCNTERIQGCIFPDSA